MAGFTLIKIFMDTNILHASQAHVLLPEKVSKYISDHKKIESVELKWLIPKMVIDERKHQMLQAAKSLLPKIDDLEKLLGHALGINDEVMEDRIDSKINKTISSLGVEVRDIDCKSVDWDELITRSATRKVPFEMAGDKEKGFRDAIIASVFLQEHSKSPSTPRSCLLVFVSGDNRLREYLTEKTESSKNIRLLETLDELKSLLNAIASEITEEFLSSISPKAKNVFWDFDKKEGLYKKAEVYKTITEDFENEINSVLEGCDKCQRKGDGVTLGEQTFIRKTGQTIVWTRLVKLDFKLTKSLDSKELVTLIIDSNKNGEHVNRSQEPKVVASGESTFSVEWQHQITTKGNISKPKINKIEFISHDISSRE